MAESTDITKPIPKPCGRAESGRPTSRRVMLQTLFGLSASTVLYANLDDSAWQAYEAVEEAWVRDRHQLLLQQAPAAVSAARIDLELKLADLQRRSMQFRHLLQCNPASLRGGVWQMTAMSVTDTEQADLMTSSEYRKACERVRQLTASLRHHKHYEILRRAQMRLWKTPQYHEIHRRYVGRMHELARAYGSPTGSAYGTAAGQ